MACSPGVCNVLYKIRGSSLYLVDTKIQGFLALPKKMGHFTNLRVILAQGRCSSCIAPVVVPFDSAGRSSWVVRLGCRFGLPCISFLRGSRGEGHIRGDFKRKQTLPSCPLPVAENRQAKQMSRDGGGVLRAVAALDRKQTLRRALGVGGWGGEREGGAVLCPDSECRQPFLPSFSHSNALCVFPALS
ncbi:unnamed protein product [Nyctereutes procyonoides]|uniref:(raccoon dog) hypothetical protein n=1 Tax=Nyctereutes procyonoides TaxID=34880 RepID=A0A811ZRG7_NYCPR|nr:unnamed protein product [Nyctereutes procyonoides]